MIQLIGPGGAGKTTIGAALAERLRARFEDLDAEFRFRHGDISSYLDERGYEAYASQNVDLFSDLAGGRARLPVYLRLAGRKVETMQPVETVVDELISELFRSPEN